jgi:hypothetical protein
LFHGDLLAPRWKDARDAHEVVARDARIAQGKLEAGEFFAVSAHPFGEKQFRWYIHL